MVQKSLTEEEEEKISNFGALGYSKKRCEILLGWTREEIEEGFGNSKTQFYKFYLEGKYKAEYVIDMKLFELAQQGDNASIKLLESRKQNRKD